MARIKLTIEVDVEEHYNCLDEEEKLWLENEILVGDGNLFLHSNEVGDTVGVVKSVKSVKWLP
jgi:hypothetical protein